MKIISIAPETSIEEISEYLKNSGDPRARIRKSNWYDVSSGQYLALNLLVILLIVFVWIITFILKLGVLMTGLLFGPVFFLIAEILPRNMLLGYQKYGYVVRFTFFCMFVAWQPTWMKITFLALASICIIAPAIFFAFEMKSLGEDNSLLHLAVYNGCERDIIKILIDAGADVNGKNSDLNTPLHFSYNNLELVQLLIDNGAKVDAENHKNQTPLDFVKKPGIASILLEAGARSNDKWSKHQVELGSTRRGLLIPQNLSKQIKIAHFLCFLSHHKQDAASTAIYFHGVLCIRFRVHSEQVFLDSNELSDLRHLIENVKKSKVLIVLQTKDILTRPFCLAEIFTAVKNEIPIVAVNIEGSGYDFNETKQFLFSSNFKTALHDKNPGACETLETQGFDVEEMGHSIGSVLPNIISKPFNPAASERVRSSQMDDITCAIIEKLL